MRKHEQQFFFNLPEHLKAKEKAIEFYSRT